MDMLLWIVIGLGVGWGGSKLMLGSGTRLITGTVAGLIGAFLGAFGMHLLHSAPRGDHVNATVAAVAGALWLAWIVCVMTFRPDGVRSAIA